MLFTVKRDTFHYLWNRKHKPILKVRPGDRVRFEVNEVTSWQVVKSSTVKDIVNMDETKLYPLSGPVYIEGAEKGDALSINVESVKTADWGFSAIIPGLGLLPEFRKPYLWTWDLKNKSFARFVRGFKVPLNPFCGVMGVAPAKIGSFSVLPPGKHGGNMDIRHLSAGARLLLPVWNPGALFSVGDIHAAMGDGEVCVTAIECPGEATFRFDLVKDAGIETPQFHARLRNDPQEYFVTTGIDPDLMEASREAVRAMISYLVKEYRLTKEEAYVLCSVASDLKIHEIVDAPNWVVGLAMPKSVFP